MARGNRPVWLFPVPVRRSQIRGPDRSLARYNVEIALERIPRFAFDRAPTNTPLLFYDYQTHLDGNYRGRLGSGRGGIFRGRFLKGVGRTPAAANWDRTDDRYHGSGHLSVGSALRERLITRCLAARGLDATIVPCNGVLLRSLAPDERRAVRAGATSSVASFAAADSEMAALTVRPADFARPANVVFALDHFDEEPRALGELFLDFERYLHAPRERTTVVGAPAAIVRAIDRAFRRSLDNFHRFARAGLLWVYVTGNFTLDGRFVDLETPSFFGAPFVGSRIAERRGASAVRLLAGFEEFAVVRYWRRFAHWLRGRFSLLSAKGSLAQPESRLFVRELAREMDRRFRRGHLLYSDAELVERAVTNLARASDLGASGRERLRKLARFAFRAIVYNDPAPVPSSGWRALRVQPAQATPIPCRFETAAFLDPKLAPDAEGFAAALERLGAERRIENLLHELSGRRLRVA